MSKKIEAVVNAVPSDAQGRISPRPALSCRPVAGGDAPKSGESFCDYAWRLARRGQKYYAAQHRETRRG